MVIVYNSFYALLDSLFARISFRVVISVFITKLAFVWWRYQGYSGLIKKVRKILPFLLLSRVFEKYIHLVEFGKYWSLMGLSFVDRFCTTLFVINQVFLSSSSWVHFGNLCVGEICQCKLFTWSTITVETITLCVCLYIYCKFCKFDNVPSFISDMSNLSLLCLLCHCKIFPFLLILSME
jgi:hypothetical protein